MSDQTYMEPDQSPVTGKLLQWRNRTLLEITRYSDNTMVETHYLPWRTMFSADHKLEILEVYYTEMLNIVENMQTVAGNQPISVHADLAEDEEYMIQLIGERNKLGGGDNPGDVVGYRGVVVFGVAMQQAIQHNNLTTDDVYNIVIQDLRDMFEELS